MMKFVAQSDVVLECVSDAEPTGAAIAEALKLAVASYEDPSIWLDQARAALERLKEAGAAISEGTADDTDPNHQP